MPVMDTVGRSRPTEQFLGTTDRDWLPHRALLDPDGMLVTAVGGFLVRGCGDRTVLVDAGLGGHPSVGIFEKYDPGRRLLDNLSQLGVGPDDITDVIFTHLHADHTGWSTKKGEVVFRSATVWCDSSDWSHFIGSDAGTTKKLSPLADRVSTWDRGGTLLSGLDILRAPGHTPGSAIVVLSSGAARALLLGDVVHCAAELVENEWEGIGDVDSALAKQTRNNLAREIEGTDLPVAASHFPEMKFGRLLLADGKRSWVFD
jgi:glyoxylase-like metal-dependent hydrolase (beta-lactamase superfamily II)